MPVCFITTLFLVLSFPDIYLRDEILKIPNIKQRPMSLYNALPDNHNLFKLITLVKFTKCIRKIATSLDDIPRR